MFNTVVVGVDGEHEVVGRECRREENRPFVALSELQRRGWVGY